MKGKEENLLKQDVYVDMVLYPNITKKRQHAISTCGSRATGKLLFHTHVEVSV